MVFVAHTFLTKLFFFYFIQISRRIVSFEFLDDPTVNESKIVVLMEQVWVYAKKKKRILGGKEEKTNLEDKKRVKIYRKYKIDMIYLYP